MNVSKFTHGMSNAFIDASCHFAALNVRHGNIHVSRRNSNGKICAYIKMDLSSKDMAPLLNMSVRSIETNRYRIRKKMDLGRETNLSDYLQKF